MPQLDIFIFQNITIYSTIIFFILSYNLYLILIKILKILKTRILLNKIYNEEPINMEKNKENQIINKLNLLIKEINDNQIKL